MTGVTDAWQDRCQQSRSYVCRETAYDACVGSSVVDRIASNAAAACGSSACAYAKIALNQSAAGSDVSAFFRYALRRLSIA